MSAIVTTTRREYSARLGAAIGMPIRHGRPHAVRVSSRPMAGGHRGEYDRRVNRVIDHIREHLADELPLAALARLAAFSPFHFHRVFRAVTGETVAGFVHRLRIEKAAAALRDHPGRAVLEIALDHGFGSAAAFARAFRARFGMSATAWRTGGAERWRRRRKPGQQLRKTGKASPRRNPRSVGAAG